MTKTTNDVNALAVGANETRADAKAKAQGREPYAADYYPDGVLWAGAVRPGARQGVAHARLLAIDTAAAAALPGVVKILTAADVPGTNRQGIVHKDMPVLVGDKLRYAGDPVALVIAESREALRQAIGLVVVSLEPLPAVCDPVAAMAEGAVRVHDERADNLLAAAEIRLGEGAQGLDHCDVVVAGSFSTPVQAHGFIETENGVACCAPDGSLTMTISTQAPFRDRMEIAHALGLSFDQIRIVAPCLGGGFGGKDGATVQCLLALAALHSDGRPVKMVWGREENLLAGYRRHSCRVDYRLGANRDGTLEAVHCRLVYDTGAYAHLGGEVMALGMEHAGGPYRIPHVLIEGQCVYTNNPVAGAMRAFGVCQVTFAFEAMIAELARELGIDPLALRRQNALLPGDTNCAGVVVGESTGIADCLDLIAGHPLWLERAAWKDAAPPGTQRGVGLAAVFNAAGYGAKVRDSAIAKVELTGDGQFVVHNAVSDMGQGNAAAFVQIAGHVLQQDAARVSVRQPDTATAYPSGSSSAGRTTFTFGNALIVACEQLKARLINRAGLLLFVDDDSTLTLVPGKIVHQASAREVSLARLAGFLRDEERSCLGEYVAPLCPDPGTGKGFFIGFPHVVFAYGAHLARIEVDLSTGQIRVVDYLAVTDGGQVINPAMYDQQVHGGVAQGLGYALMEDLATRDGQVLAGDFSRYLIPGALDLPEITSVACPGEESRGPFGMKGIGEVAMNGPLPAVANALADGCAIHLRDAPLTPERVLLALESLAEESSQ
ncbi:MAG: xanthine dehydrogenase, molybdenum binding subunit apoprotein [Proteobacteria bacterium]|nr:xanthine dehydrogenase, molybdenum binding subunit apoprotein [Pseudomonadota bacterium]